MREVSKWECVIMGDFNRGHIQWKSLVLQSAGGNEHQFLLLSQTQDCLLAQHVLEPTRAEVGMC